MYRIIPKQLPATTGTCYALWR